MSRANSAVETKTRNLRTQIKPLSGRKRKNDWSSDEEIFVNEFNKGFAKDKSLSAQKGSPAGSDGTKTVDTHSGRSSIKRRGTNRLQLGADQSSDDEYQEDESLPESQAESGGEADRGPAEEVETVASSQNTSGELSSREAGPPAQIRHWTHAGEDRSGSTTRLDVQGTERFGYGLRNWAGPGVYEEIFKAYGGPKCALHPYNVTEIVKAAADLKDFLATLQLRENGRVQQWVNVILVWRRDVVGKENYME
ncbi:hypothetical protein K470DRAFT_277108 [Piedraia hortae CBS 480.64]|uniref:Uncharacterized protein n=1 Tax=Piedraia hortae CBS 480.64 TaxID=1314780 RepID=A0A6A7C0C6_9PEZI|nr:hypothetical protein K470DRAFT_277108 [Piedraia hortae CBS 480.64]